MLPNSEDGQLKSYVCKLISTFNGTYLQEKIFS